MLPFFWVVDVEDTITKLSRNAGNRWPGDAASHPRRTETSTTPRKSHIKL